MKQGKKYALNLLLIIIVTVFAVWFALKDNYEEVLRLISSMEDDMAAASRDMDFEEAARLRDQVVKLKSTVEDKSEEDAAEDSAALPDDASAPSSENKAESAND